MLYPLATTTRGTWGIQIASLCHLKYIGIWPQQIRVARTQVASLGIFKRWPLARNSGSQGTQIASLEHRKFYGLWPQKAWQPGKKNRLSQGHLSFCCLWLKNNAILGKQKSSRTSQMLWHLATTMIFQETQIASLGNIKHCVQTLVVRGTNSVSGIS